MARKFQLGHRIYDISVLGPKGRKTFDMLEYAKMRLDECQQKEAALKRAHNACVTQLRAEIVTSRSGVNLNDLLGD